MSGTILVTGGGSGIGVGLAAAFHARAAQVIVAGRTRAGVEDIAARHPGMAAEVVDVADPEQVAALAALVAERWPGLDTVVNNAGIQTLFDFTGPEPLAVGPARVLRTASRIAPGLFLNIVNKARS